MIKITTKVAEAPQNEVSVWTLENGIYEFKESGCYGRFYLLTGEKNWRQMIALERENSHWTRETCQMDYPKFIVVRKFENMELS